jgi:hypothetical protein
LKASSAKLPSKVANVTKHQLRASFYEEPRSLHPRIGCHRNRRSGTAFTPPPLALRVFASSVPNCAE